MSCRHDGCGNTAEEGRDECFRHRVLSVGFALKAPARQGDFHRTVREHKEMQWGTSDDRELAKRGIVKASEYGW